MRMKVRRFLFLSVSAVSFFGLFLGADAQQIRESILELKSHVEDAAHMEIPKVFRWCDRLELKKMRIAFGDTNLYVEEEGKGVPMVLINGGPGATHHKFHPEFSRANRYARVIYYDQRGCGLSDHEPGNGYTVEQAAADLERLRERLGIAKWVVLGHSYGGFLAQLYTTLYPERVAGLVLVCASTGLHAGALRESKQWDYISKEERQSMSRFRKEIRQKADEENWLPDRTQAVEVFNNFLNGDWKRQSYYRPTMEEIAQTALYEWNPDLENNFNSVMSGQMRSISLAGAFQNNPIPTLILEGLWDLTWNESKAMLFHKNHPNAEIAVFAKSAHSPFADEPDRFFETLGDFIHALKPVPDSQIALYQERLKSKGTTYQDPFLAAPVSDREKSEKERYGLIFNRIRSGVEYFNLSSPLDCHLSFYSVCCRQDSQSFKSIQPSRNWKPETFQDHKTWLEETDVWRIPEPPKNPEPGQIWPVYVTNALSNAWEETFLFAFWDGRWERWGNMGGPFTDWRDSEDRIQRDFLVERLKK